MGDLRVRHLLQNEGFVFFFFASGIGVLLLKGKPSEEMACNRKWDVKAFYTTSEIEST